jgi:hypothetical protein
MRLKTDDAIWRVRLVWLGPDEFTMPIQLPYAQYGLWVCLAFPCALAGWLLTHSFLSFGTSLCVAAGLTFAVYSRVDPDQTARQVLAMTLTDWRRTPPPATVRLPTATTRKVRITPAQTGADR